MNVYDLAHSLAREIKKSDEYKSYQEIRDKIRDNKTTLEMLRDFRRNSLNYRARPLPGRR